MTPNEIKLEALRIMFANTSDLLVTANMETYVNDEQYKVYLGNMNGAINRCFGDLERKGVLPSKVSALNANNASVSSTDNYTRFDLSQIADYKSVERIVYENEFGDYNGDSFYRIEGNMLVLPKYMDYETYTLVYKPKLTRLSGASNMNAELPIPDDIASCIPYYVKGDLFRDDEPKEASEARNWYEMAMEQIMRENSCKQDVVVNVFDQTEN